MPRYYRDKIFNTEQTKSINDKLEPKIIKAKLNERERIHKLDNDVGDYQQKQRDVLRKKIKKQITKGQSL